MEIKELRKKDIPAIWNINQQGLPGTGEVTHEEVETLLEFASFSVGIFEHDELLGFVICMPPGTQYSSPNYSWFNDKYDSFVYVDRIAVSELHRNKSIGTHLYDFVVEIAMNIGAPVVAEVSLKPPNPGSMRFHSRFQFEEVGVLHHGTKSVTMLMRPTDS
jgi:predicted GNAT superfamily acetyltransferase